VARKKRICPFSEKACINCSLYIGRHYLLCDRTGSHEQTEDGVSGKNKLYAKRDMTVPEFAYNEELDPFKELL
jgi:hypothetical protein